MLLNMYSILIQFRYQIHEDIPKTLERCYKPLIISNFMKILEIFNKI